MNFFAAYAKSVEALLGTYQLQDPFLGLFLWQIIALFLAALMSGLVVFSLFAFRESFRTTTPNDIADIKTFQRRITELCMISAIIFVIPHLNLDASSASISMSIRCVHIIGGGILALLVYQGVGLFFVRYTQTLSKKYGISLATLQILKSPLQVVITGFSFIPISRFFVTFEASTLVGYLSIGGGTVAAMVAFASKDLIANFFGAIVIMVGKPFKVGDWIVLDKVQGRVVDINVRATQLDTGLGNFIYVPNGKFTNQYVRNYGKGLYIPMIFSVPLRETSTAHFEKFLAQLHEVLTTHPHLIGSKSHIDLSDMGKASSTLTLHLSLKKVKAQEKLVHTHELLHQVSDLAKKNQLTLS